MKQADIDQAKSEVAKTLEAKLSQKGDYTKQLRRAKRHMPRKALKKAEIISKAEHDLKHPHMRKFVDKTAVAQAKRDLIHAADKMDPAAKRSKFWFSWGSGLVFNLIVAMIAIFTLSSWLSSGQ